ncbi:hypothetical protein [Halopiger djelfimassiliensis]|uniref:hypothetical protein n=1 Tax=Halopiger djelfimassiliensis TaxID=1293047 RepID=UPI00067816AE|nr:hypothetical protein [Halopiger djelfimassiliensis]
MVTESELQFVVVVLSVYTTAFVTSNHHPQKSLQSFGAGVANLILMIGIALYGPDVITYIGLSVSGLSVVIALQAVTILGIWYYAAENRVEQFLSRCLDPLVALFR